MEKKMINLTIDNIPVTVPEGTTVLEAARAAGVRIPTHDDAILTPSTAAAEAFELLLRLIKIGDEVKPQIMRAIYI